MARDATLLQRRYASAAPRWADKMRVLGYYDGYLGFLSHLPREDMTGARVIDIGAGTGAMAEAWVAIHGAPRRLVLLDPAAAMLATARGALARRGVTCEAQTRSLGEAATGQYDVVLAAHVIEHFADPGAALAQMRALAAPGARLWLSVSKPHWCSAIVWMQWRHRTFRRAEISALLAAAGFCVEGFYAFPSGPPSRTSFGVVARASR